MPAVFNEQEWKRPSEGYHPDLEEEPPQMVFCVWQEGAGKQALIDHVKYKLVTELLVDANGINDRKIEDLLKGEQVSFLNNTGQALVLQITEYERHGGLMLLVDKKVKGTWDNVRVKEEFTVENSRFEAGSIVSIGDLVKDGQGLKIGLGWGGPVKHFTSLEEAKDWLNSHFELEGSSKSVVKNNNNKYPSILDLYTNISTSYGELDRINSDLYFHIDVMEGDAESIIKEEQPIPEATASSVSRTNPSPTATPISTATAVPTAVHTEDARGAIKELAGERKVFEAAKEIRDWKEVWVWPEEINIEGKMFESGAILKIGHLVEKSGRWHLGVNGRGGYLPEQDFASEGEAKQWLEARFKLVGPGVAKLENDIIVVDPKKADWGGEYFVYQGGCLEDNIFYEGAFGYQIHFPGLEQPYKPLKGAHIEFEGSPLFHSLEKQEKWSVDGFKTGGDIVHESSLQKPIYNFTSCDSTNEGKVIENNINSEWERTEFIATGRAAYLAKEEKLYIQLIAHQAVTIDGDPTRCEYKPVARLWAAADDIQDFYNSYYYIDTTDPTNFLVYLNYGADNLFTSDEVARISNQDLSAWTDNKLDLKFEVDMLRPYYMEKLSLNNTLDRNRFYRWVENSFVGYEEPYDTDKEGLRRLIGVIDHREGSANVIAGFFGIAPFVTNVDIVNMGRKPRVTVFFNHNGFNTAWATFNGLLIDKDWPQGPSPSNIRLISLGSLMK